MKRTTTKTGRAVGLLRAGGKPRVAEAAVLRDVGFYFYGVVRAGTDVAGLRGLDDVEVEAVEHGGLGAVISSLALDRPRGRAAELVAHARVVDALAAVTE